MVRLALFRDSGYKMLLQGGEVANVEEKVHNVRRLHHALGGGSGRPGGYPGPGNLQNYNGYIPQHLEGRAMSALNRFGESAKLASSMMRLNRFQQNLEPPAFLMENPTLSTIWSQKGLCGQFFVAGEVLCILRPLIYVLFIRKYGIQSWTPWLVSLAVDLTGMGVLSRATYPSRGRGEDEYFQLSTSEKDEASKTTEADMGSLHYERSIFYEVHQASS
ncbi:peroxisome biogenesis protein 16 [Iris pallida]|uniref:Peroxisomal membrane protein PEX16 n=1 Tax=Iris pallida TaxID=29817 RepID=A0AAX6HHE8_IRIPA|nr:peroxisome biogenesis protein 16 [Iris pallida]